MDGAGGNPGAGGGYDPCECIVKIVFQIIFIVYLIH
jgi:hypothetical protein